LPRYPTTWLEYTLPTGEDFSVAVCGYSGKIRYMVIGDDTVRKQMIIFNRHYHNRMFGWRTLSRKELPFEQDTTGTHGAYV